MTERKSLLTKVKSLSFLLTPILVSVFPILSFYVNNMSELALIFLEKPLLYSTSASILLTLILYAIIKDKYKSALIATTAIFIFFSYGHLSKYLNDKLFIPLPSGIVLGPDKILLPTVLILFAFFIYKIIKTKESLSRIITFINIVLLLLVAYSTIIIINNEFQKGKQENVSFGIETNQQNDHKETPDIYHIVLDGYARNDILKEIYDYDNGEFVDSLEKMGFFVAEKARSNYVHTYLSLPSTFNMMYLDFLPEKYGENPPDGSVAKNMMFNSLVSEKLKNYGYKSINFVSDWEGTNENYSADIVINEERTFKTMGVNIATSETNMVFLQTTLLSPLVQEVWENALRRKALSVFEKMPDVAYLEDKKYVLAHIMAPHPPYVFSEDGGLVDGADLDNADEGAEKRPKYLNQLKFISKQTLPMLKYIINNSKNPPIIILQSDHGPASMLGKRENWNDNYSSDAVNERSGILYAIYLPDQDYKNFYQTMTPVNTYRIIFSKYFGEELELLPDKSFYTSYDAIYKFRDITDTLHPFDNAD